MIPDYYEKPKKDILICLRINALILNSTLDFYNNSDKALTLTHNWLNNRKYQVQTEPEFLRRKLYSLIMIISKIFTIFWHRFEVHIDLETVKEVDALKTIQINYQFIKFLVVTIFNEIYFVKFNIYTF